MATILQKPQGLVDKFVRKPGEYDQVTHYCPGCGHGRIHKLIAEAMDDFNIGDKTNFISPVGCSVFGTGLARSNPGSITISYQGDGDLGAIGTAEIIHAANRGENMTVIFVNNGIYGMTGGQMAPTTLEGQVTATSPSGRIVDEMGYPMRMSEIISTLEAPVYVERVAVTDIKGIMKARKAIRKAIKSQQDGYGFSFVEILSACPVGWKMTPLESTNHIKNNMEKYFPIQKFKDVIEDRSPKPIKSATIDPAKIIEVLGVDQDKKLFKEDKAFIDAFKDQHIRIAGFGGQGVLLAGTTIGYLGMEKNLYSTWLPSYGPEMRGGTANCHIVISNQKVGSPLVDKATCLIAMNAPSLVEFAPTVEKNGVIIINSSIIPDKSPRKDVNNIYIPMSEIAEECGVKQAANMAAIAAYLTYTKAFSIDDFKSLITASFKKKNLIEKNLAVIMKAHEYCKDLMA